MANNKIFVSYRRQDASGEAGRLVDHLQEVFGDESVFLDVETIEAGLDFVQAIDRALNSCKVLIAMIGPHWATIKDPQGGLRLFKEDDFIRIEISAALKRDIRVIPVLVNGAVMPTSDQLPDDLKGLTRRHAQELSSSRWKYDCEQLTLVLKKLIDPKPKPTPIPVRGSRPLSAPPKPKSWWARNYLWVLGLFVVILIGGQLMDLEDGGKNGPYVEDDHRGGDTADFRADGEETYQDLQLGGNNPPVPVTDVLQVEGRWTLYMDNNPTGTLVFDQYGSNLEFIEYNMIDLEVGNGSGSFSQNTINLQYYNSVVGIIGTIELNTRNTGTTWTGKITIPSTGAVGAIELRRN